MWNPPVVSAAPCVLPPVHLGALRLHKKESAKILPNDTQALYGRLMLDRYGPWGMAKIAALRLLGKKV